MTLKNLVMSVTEGPTAHYKAWILNREFKGKILRQIDFRVKTRLEPKVLINKPLDRVECFGKNFVFVFGNYAVRTHLMLYGTIHTYGLNDKLAKPESKVKAIFVFDDKKFVIYNAPVLQLDYYTNIVRALKEILGPDPLRKDWDPNLAIKNILAQKERKIGDVLLDQKVIAGLGNILRNEILFRARIHPDKLVRNLNYEQVKRIVEIAHDLSVEFFERKKRGERIGPLLMVYGRANKPCKVCGTKIRLYYQPPNNRRTYYCPKCQRL